MLTHVLPSLTELILMPDACVALSHGANARACYYLSKVFIMLASSSRQGGDAKGSVYKQMWAERYQSGR